MNQPSRSPRIPAREVRRMVPWAAFVVALLVLALIAPGLVQKQQEYLFAQKAASVNVLSGTMAPPLGLVDAHGRPFSLSSLRGRAVLVAFLGSRGSPEDDLVAREIRLALNHAGSLSGKIAFVMVNVDATHRGTGDVLAFERRWGLQDHPNVYFLTGPPDRLKAVWQSYGIFVGKTGAAITHSSTMYILDPSGRERYMMDASSDPAVTLGYAQLFLHYLGLARHP